VVYVGRDPVGMAHALEAENMAFAYHLVDLKTFPYQTFLASDQTQEAVLAVLADFGGEPAALVAKKFIARLETLSQGNLELSQRTLQLVRLAVLRNLGTTIYNIVQKMVLDIDITEDALYQLGEQKGKEEDAFNMLQEGFSAEVVARITKLPAERIAQLKQQLEAGQ